MPIHSRTAGGLRIVEVNGDETIPTDYSIEFTQRLSHRGFAGDVVTCREKVRGIEANTQALGLEHALDDVGKLLKFVSQTRSLARSCLQCDSRFDFWKTSQHAIN